MDKSVAKGCMWYFVVSTHIVLSFFLVVTLILGDSRGNFSCSYNTVRYPSNIIHNTLKASTFEEALSYRKEIKLFRIERTNDFVLVTIEVLNNDETVRQTYVLTRTTYIKDNKTYRWLGYSEDMRTKLYIEEDSYLSQALIECTGDSPLKGFSITLSLILY